HRIQQFSGMAEQIDVAARTEYGKQDLEIAPAGDDSDSGLPIIADHSGPAKTRASQVRPQVLGEQARDSPDRDRALDPGNSGKVGPARQQDIARSANFRPFAGTQKRQNQTEIIRLDNLLNDSTGEFDLQHIQGTAKFSQA